MFQTFQHWVRGHLLSRRSGEIDYDDFNLTCHIIVEYYTRLMTDGEYKVLSAFRYEWKGDAYSPEAGAEQFWTERYELAQAHGHKGNVDILELFSDSTVQYHFEPGFQPFAHEVGRRVFKRTWRTSRFRSAPGYRERRWRSNVRGVTTIGIAWTA